MATEADPYPYNTMYDRPADHDGPGLEKRPCQGAATMPAAAAGTAGQALTPSDFSICVSTSLADSGIAVPGP
jgi:hypothetical protein